MNKLILFNAPAGVGKDVAFDHLKDLGYPFVKMETKEHLHILTQRLFNVSEDQYWLIYEDRTLKETPNSLFKVTGEAAAKLFSYLKYKWDYDEINECYYIDKNSTKRYYMGRDSVTLSVREAVIYVSELVCKPTFGASYFGDIRASKLSSLKENETAVDPSFGFIEELLPAINTLGNDNVLVIRVFRDGYTFEGDSRSYLTDEEITKYNINCIDIYNNDSLTEYLDEVSCIVFNMILDEELK